MRPVRTGLCKAALGCVGAVTGCARAVCLGGWQERWRQRVCAADTKGLTALQVNKKKVMEEGNASSTHGVWKLHRPEYQWLSDRLLVVLQYFGLVRRLRRHSTACAPGMSRGR